jgi:IclR family transcriptional regulator, pca regulon regulatory protein
MAVLDGPEIVYLARVAKHQPLNIAIRIGDRLPAHSTALGRILLAGKSKREVRAILARSQIRRFTDATIIDPLQLVAIVEQARRQGWTFVIGEQLPGLASVAVPIRNIEHRTVAALNASAQHLSSAANLVDSALPLLRTAAAQIEFAISRVHSLAAHLDELADVNHDEAVALSLGDKSP